MDEAAVLIQAIEGLAETQPVRRQRARLRLPLIGRSVRVRTLSLGVSAVLHALFLGALLCAKLAAPLPVPLPLVEVEFVEIAGAKGGGGSPGVTQALPASREAAPAPKAPQAMAIPDPAARRTEAPPVPSAPQAAPVTATGTGAPTASTGGSGGGTGGGQGGGQGTGSGQSVGSGTGQGGIAVDRMPVAVKRVKPIYPMNARRRGISGQVTLRLYVDAEGGVREVLVQAAEPAGVFEEKAVEAARKWRFEPAVFKGAPVGVWMTLPVRFALDGR
ncbi:MAG: energy transducer TonB [Desulfovibrio sp.]|jgi:protein TonB|nr:energy transducer TonB [Desulfovibrio sp.]